MKLIAVFIHEMGHATACWWTGGKVEKIEVYTNEGGVTKYRGGVRALIIPAGYVGGAFWGGVFVTLSGDRVAATIAASIFVLAMLVSLRFSPNGMLVGLTLGFSLVTLLFIFLEWFVFSPLLQYVTLYYGVFIGSFSVCTFLKNGAHTLHDFRLSSLSHLNSSHFADDIYDDLITRTVEGSDAHACHQLIPCCFPRCVGVQFAILALFFQGLGVYLALVWMTSV